MSKFKVGDRVKLSSLGKLHWSHSGFNPHDLEGEG